MHWVDKIEEKCYNVLAKGDDCMLKRRAYKKLLDWKNKKKKPALFIYGARQIGKTTLIREFAKEQYENFVEINFILDENAKLIFSGKYDADTIISNLTAYTRKALVPGKTLILFDEIQSCPEVRTAIKFLVEDGRFDYIETGSMLGVMYKHVRSYPVGFEEIYQMFPMDFEEFLIANGVQEKTINELKECYDEEKPVPEIIHQTIIKLFQTYVVVGGMPQVVQTYVDTHDIGRVIETQNSILAQYRLDISQYAKSSEKIKIKSIFDSIPAQLDDKNRRFILSYVDENGRMNRYENSFVWLSDAGVALPCYNVTAPVPPLQLNEKRNLFKLFMGDVGLLCAACMENIQFSILNGDLSINMGSILENVMAMQLKSNGYSLYYYDTKKYGEVDFVIQNGTKCELVEIKSGKDYKKHNALDNVRDVTEWEIEKSYVFCNENLQVENGVKYLPWYMIMFFKQEKIENGTIFEVDISNL